jgi:hypothetical protein
MKKRISRAGLYTKLDATRGHVNEWLDHKRLLDAEFLAAEADAIVVAGSFEYGCEDLDEYFERKFA